MVFENKTKSRRAIRYIFFKKAEKAFLKKDAAAVPNAINTMKKIIILVLVATFVSCKTNQTRHKLKVGKWIYADTVNNIVYKSIGKYRRNIEKGTWKSFEGEKLIKEEKYKNGICHTKTYHQNGQIASIGKTKLAESATETHWYYFDQWQFFDTYGKRIETKFYEKGELDSIRKFN